MAGVQAQPEYVGVQPAELGCRLGGVLDDAPRFGLEGHPDPAAGVPVDRGEPGREPVQGAAGGVRPVRRPRCPPAERKGGDAAAQGVVREQPGQDTGAGEGVPQTFLVGPVGLVDVLFDDLALEPLVRKRVEGDGLQASREKTGAQPGHGTRVVRQFGHHVPGEPEPDAERIRAEFLPYGFRVAGELGHDAVQVLGGVHVAAVGEVDGGAVGVAESHGGHSPPRRMELPSYTAAASEPGSSSWRSRRPLWP